MVTNAGGFALLLMSALLGAVMALQRRKGCGCVESEAVATGRRAVRTRAAIATGVALASMAALVAFLPVRATAVSEGEIAITSDATPDEPPGALTPEDLQIQIIATGGVTMSPPQPIAFAIEQQLPGVVLAGWSRPPNRNDLLVADTADNEILITGRFSSLDLPFETGPGAGTVEIEAGDVRAVIDLESTTAGHNVVRVSAGGRRTTASTPFLWSDRTLRLPEPASELEWAAIGLLPVRAEPVVGDTGAVIAVRVDAADTARALARAGFDLLVLAAVALVLGLVGLVVGTACGPRRVARGVLAGLRLATYGLALGMLIVGAANYFVAARWAVVILVPIILVGLTRMVRQTGESPSVVPEGTPVGASGAIIAAIVVAAINGLWFMLSGRWSLGFLQTDVFDTFNVTELLWRRSALDASIAFGDGFRLLDYTARATVWGTMLDRPSDAIVVFRLLLSVLVAALAANLVARQGYGAWVQVVVGTLVSGSAAYVGLYAEGYMSREFFVSWLLLGLLAAAHQLLDTDVRMWAWWKVGVIGCVSLAVVPPYFLMAPALVAVLIASVAGSQWRDRALNWSPAVGGFGLSVLALGVPNLFWLRSSSDAEQYIDTLNALVRNIGVPFYDSVRLPAAMLGLLPFHHQDGYRLGGSTFELGPFRWGTDWLAGTVVAWVFLISTSLVAALSVWIVARRSRSSVDRGFAALWIAVAGFYIMGILVLRVALWNAQTYFTIMWIWTLAPIALTALVLLFLEAGRLEQRARTLLLGGVLVLALVNALAAAGESVLWVESPFSERASKWHYDQAVPLDRFDRALQAGDVDIGDDEFAVVIDQPSALTGTDDDRVLTNVIVNLLEATGTRCTVCVRNPDFYWVTASQSAPTDIPIVRIGSTECGPRPTIYTDDYFAICASLDR